MSRSVFAKFFDRDLRGYVMRSFAWRFRPSLARCPACGAGGAEVMGRKALVTKLVRCPTCELLYRVPQEPRDWQQRFYQKGYESSLATRLPNESELATMKSKDFRGTEKDFTKKIGVLRSLGARAGDRVLDFGCSWGYGVWQLQAAGYQAAGFEVSRERARFGREHLGLEIESNLESFKPETFDFVFSNHVFEHLPDPSKLAQILGNLLRPDGLAVAWFPNGSDAHRDKRPSGYHHSWGRLHAVYLDERFLRKNLTGLEVGFLSQQYGETPDLQSISKWRTLTADSDLSGPEMLMIARKMAE